MFLIIFKLPRTGSTRLAKYINRRPEARFFHEILKKSADGNHNDNIRARLDGIAKGHSITGFSLNPFPYNLESPEFFDPGDYLEKYGRGLVVSHLRKNVFDQAVSLWLSIKLKVWPGDSSNENSRVIKDFLKSQDTAVPLRNKKGLVFVRD